MPYTGHITPTFNLTKALLELDSSVDYLTSENWRDIVEKIGAGHIAYSDSDSLQITDIYNEVYNKALGIGNRYDAIIYDELFFLGKRLCEKLEIPAIRYFPCIAINRNLMRVMTHGHGFMGIFRFAIVRKMWTKKICRPLKLKISDWTVEVTDNPPDRNIVFVPEWFQPELESFPSDEYKFVGTSVYKDSYADIEIEKSNLPLIYMALGTIDNNKANLYNQCLEMFAGKEARLILAVGDKIDIGTLGEIPSNCTVYEYAPQKEILEKSDLFITHGGMNSIAESIQFGVPMLVAPMSNDQPINAKQIQRLGIGREIDILTLSADELWSNIISVTSDSMMKQNIRRYQLQASKNDGGRIAATYVLEEK
jgi:MGT family glycosyltransferase